MGMTDKKIEIPASDGSSGMTSPKVLVLEDDPAVMHIVQEVLVRIGIDVIRAVSCLDGRERLLEHPDVAVILSDHLLPDGTGVEFLKQARSQYPAAVRIMMTGAYVYDRNIAVDAINKGEIFRFLAKPFSPEELIGALNQAIEVFSLRMHNARLQARLAGQEEGFYKHYTAALLDGGTGAGRRISQEAIELAMAIAGRVDMVLCRHLHRVARLAVALGKEMGLGERDIVRLELAGLLHDLSLLGLWSEAGTLQRQPDRLELHPRKEVVFAHVEQSAHYADFFPFPEVAEAVRNHHEYLDGSGYPRGLAGEQLSLLTLILSVADCYDELATSPDFVLSQFEIDSGVRFAPDVVRALLRVVARDDIHLLPEQALLVSELRPGMKLAASIYTTAGMLLVREDTVLDETLVAKLNQHNKANAISQAIFVVAPGPTAVVGTTKNSPSSP
jgi:response regulator RpfG family c-di-GMP phosphodiesterase